MTQVAYFGRVQSLLDTQVLIGTSTEIVWATPYYIDIPIALSSGDILKVTAEQEVECTVSYNTELVSQVVLSSGWCANNMDEPTSGYLINETIGYDASVNPIHYWNITRSAEFQVPADMQAAVIQFRIRCRSSSASGNDWANIKSGYGHLSVSVWRG